MLVSAISNNRFTAANNSSSEKVNSQNSDSIADTTFYSLSPKTSEKDLMAIYDAINKWKLFCHSQIEAGKFDIIA